MDTTTLKLLSKEYPTIKEAAAEIVNLNAILTLPKGTEYFFSDLHGEYEAFSQLLRSASGNIMDKINQIFDASVTTVEKEWLTILICEPKRILKQEREKETYKEWFGDTVVKLIQVVKAISEKYTRSKVRKKAPQAFSYVIDELLHVEYENKTLYYDSIIDSIFDTGMAEDFITGICQMIQRLAVDSLHIIGDIYDKGPHADKIMEELITFGEVDIQWGNHDMLWMGAACGNRVCMAQAICNSIRYNSFDFLEDGYGINLRALSIFAEKTYGDDPCEQFIPKKFDENKYDPVDSKLAAKMFKSMMIILLKEEGQLYKQHPEYKLTHRIMLEKINYEAGTVTLDGATYELKDKNFPTVNPEDPLALTEEERELMEVISSSFLHSANLQRHVKFLYTKGSMYKVVNGNLLYHGCIPLNEDGSMWTIVNGPLVLYGKAYLDVITEGVKSAIVSAKTSKPDIRSRDFMWYLWCGPHSPLFGKSKMSTFEQYFIADKASHKEVRNPYYDWMENPDIIDSILENFGLQGDNCHIVNGHVPVKVGENPIKAEGKLFVIDGGISKAYHTSTGIGGYTLIYSSNNLLLAEHKPFVNGATYLLPKVAVVKHMEERILVGDIDKGKELREDIVLLERLIDAYRSGRIKEKY
jgi:fructose-1,6-bisphosphatase-3